MGVEKQTYDNGKCATCHSDMVATETTKLVCGHYSHPRCIKVKYADPNTCPSCQAPLTRKAKRSPSHQSPVRKSSIEDSLPTTSYECQKLRGSKNTRGGQVDNNPAEEEQGIDWAAFRNAGGFGGGFGCVRDEDFS